ncbi:hypothetical protein QBA54_35145 [Streptomyces sp. B21-108]
MPVRHELLDAFTPRVAWSGSVIACVALQLTTALPPHNSGDTA